MLYRLMPILRASWRGRHVLMALLLLTLALRAEVVDRIAVAVNNRAIKEQQIVSDIRLTCFLNGAPLDLSPAAKRKAADRLIDQTIIRAEMSKGTYPAPAAGEIDAVLAKIKQARFPKEPDYQQALKTYGIADPELKSHVAWQVQVLHFVALRFEPVVRKQAVATIKPAALGERVNSAFFAWLDESRARSRIQFHDEVFQ